VTEQVSNTETLPLFARFVERTLGLSFSDERLPELARKVAALSKEAGYPDPGQYMVKLMSAPLSRQQLDTLASTLTIGETYFLRDPKSYRILENHILPELVAARRGKDQSLRIWSAGCSSGEEPYSLAILLSRVIPDLAKWNVTLLASDVNPLALERGRLGVYGKWSFRNAPPWLMGYFSKTEDGRFEILPRIRGMVRFSNINLAEEAVGLESYGANEMDIIFCRNVMLYFNAAQIEKTMTKFHAALKESGWLFVGPAEVDQEKYQGFSCRHFDGAFASAPELRRGLAPQVRLPLERCG
jgi:chemotaxis protein methyltransferase CheR